MEYAQCRQPGSRCSGFAWAIWRGEPGTTFCVAGGSGRPCPSVALSHESPELLPRHSLTRTLPMRSGLTLTLCLIAQGCARVTSDQTTAGAAALSAGRFSSANPFAQPSSLPYHAPAFDRIRDADYQPAIEE